MISNRVKNFSLAEIDKIRNQGLRPQAVGCILNGKKIFFLFKEKHNLWQLPQGGIDNQETIDQAIKREMKEELGEKFVNSCDQTTLIIGEDQVLFPTSTQNAKELRNDKGEKVFMKGKKYFFVLVNTNNSKINIKDTEFDDYQWLSLAEAMALANKIYQPGKKRITIKALNLLKEAGWL